MEHTAAKGMVMVMDGNSNHNVRCAKKTKGQLFRREGGAASHIKRQHIIDFACHAQSNSYKDTSSTVTDFSFAQTPIPYT